MAESCRYIIIGVLVIWSLSDAISRRVQKMEKTIINAQKILKSYTFLCNFRDDFRETYFCAQLCLPTKYLKPWAVVVSQYLSRKFPAISTKLKLSNDIQSISQLEMKICCKYSAKYKFFAWLLSKEIKSLSRELLKLHCMNGMHTSEHAMQKVTKTKKIRRFFQKVLKLNMTSFSYVKPQQQKLCCKNCTKMTSLNFLIK